MSRILKDLVAGEIQQLANHNEDRHDRFQLYIDKSYNKTASLLANMCKAVAILATSKVTSASSQPDHQNTKSIETSAFHFGKNIGIAFQLIDDWLDFAATANQLGKPAAADLR